ncbi:pullulanase precursor [Clostridium tepidiprofundi DSM 19306]|uniref:pullulanase n=1 Tax=Clostridium tepidiprofundi DSM 19306 TaxID=1121338 RepID=A0A151B643_9CLOT|nr:type I pullulanase [Clostridium tepidiprofundi]KYH35117.1 pullulanase precursor [Clostridium tepidiprofundi DSM 19306]
MKKITLALIIIFVMQIFTGCTNTNKIGVDDKSKNTNQKIIGSNDNKSTGSKLVIHYFRYDGDYKDWNFWIWQEGKDGKEYDFTGQDNFGKIAEIQFDKKIKRVGIISRLGEWEDKDIDKDRFIDLKDGVTEVWMVQDTEKIAYSRDEADNKPKIKAALLESRKKIHVILSNELKVTGKNNEDFIVKVDEKDIPIEKVYAKNGNKVSSNSFYIILKEDVDFTRKIEVYNKNFNKRRVDMGKILETSEFTYTGDDLGANYTKQYTLFKVWSPVAQNMKLVIYNDYNDKVGKVYDMKKGEKGVWEYKLAGDNKNKYYNYRVTINGVEKETPDPYAKGATVNGQKGMIVDFSSLNPDGWDSQRIPEPIKTTEAVAYEMHVRDFSISKDSGMKNKGKYLAFTEKGTKISDRVVTGLDHIKELGITHLHLMPVYDFASVDETKEGYNWGYDPYLYNVPEGSYSTNPYDGRVRIKEFKQMVQSLHENDIRVVMDVVFNHTFSTGDSPFDILVPKYYYRTNSNGEYTNGSGCGNETASEKPMMRKFIVDSVKFWATEYKIDGFRFDLMALHDIDTMKEVKRELMKINPNILIYGEPWTGGTSSLSPTKQFRKGSQKGLDIAVFNDDFRNAIKGDNDGAGLGFVNGGFGFEKAIKKGIAGSIKYSNSLQGFTQEPGETINYVSSHDNLCLFDKFEKSNPKSTPEEREKMNRLALSIVLTSEGIPFIQGGTEILRTKQGVHNSYNSGDNINEIEWNRKEKYYKTYEYIKGLIELRKSQKVMTLDSAEEIRKSLKFIDSPKNTVAYLLKSSHKGDFKNIFIIHNANKSEVSVKLPSDGEWKVIANEYQANKDGVTKGVKEFSGEVKVAPLSTYILFK